MAIEALHLYLLLIKVFNTYYKHYLLKLSLAGWGIPGIIVATSLCVKNFKQFYGVTELTISDTNQTNKICWITDDSYFYSMNLVYFTLIFIFNSGILMAVASSICKMKQMLTNSKLGANTSGKSKGVPQGFSMSCQSGLTLLGLTCLMGITWGLAFLGSGYVNYPVLYLFCILNSLQDVKLPAHCDKQPSTTQSNAASRSVIIMCLTKSKMKWIALYLFTFFLPTTTAFCPQEVISNCMEQDPIMWTRCYEDEIATCKPRGRVFGFARSEVNSSVQAELSPTFSHKVQIPSSALQRNKAAQSEETVLVVVSVINSTLFQKKSHRRGEKESIPQPPVSVQETVFQELVLFVRAGSQPVSNLTEPVKLIFDHNKKVKNGTCVFWKEAHFMNETGGWSTEGCNTNKTGEEFICSCNHLSFFAVLVNPDLKVDKSHAVSLSYITYIGSALSAFFAFISLFIYVNLHRQRPEKALGIHMQLTGALLCLHLSFLSGSFWIFLLEENEDSWVCRGLGLFLHWSLLATFTWVTLEGFHLYLLLIRVFNIYVRRYLFKLCMVGWGFPTLVAVICGALGVYGKYTLEVRDSNNHTSTSKICWMSSEFQQRKLVIYITVAFLCLVVLYNSCMLLLVVSKIRGLRGGRGDCESSEWKKMNKEKGSRLWKDCATVLGLSCVLGLPWGLASLTYATLPGIYLFTIFNSLQGLFMFLWSAALSCKSRSENNSSVRDPSTQKMMTTSFNH
ncbi:adhesion G-protein coupled receptor G1-like [Anableps anableps]